MREKRDRKKLGFWQEFCVKISDPPKFMIFCVKISDPPKIQILKFCVKISDPQNLSRILRQRPKIIYLEEVLLILAGKAPQARKF